jgi:hypothetical protein
MAFSPCSRSFVHSCAKLLHFPERELYGSSMSSNITSTDSRNRALHITNNDGNQNLVSDDEEIESRPVRSIHELRQAGDNARFRESVEVIFEDTIIVCDVSQICITRIWRGYRGVPLFKSCQAQSITQERALACISDPRAP